MRRTSLLFVTSPLALFAHAAGVPSPSGRIAFAPARSSPVQSQLTYTGDEPCLRCHYEFAQQWHTGELERHSVEIRKTDLKTTPGQQLNRTLLDAMPTGANHKRGVTMPSSLGCESCHGPGSFHNPGLRGEIVRWPRSTRGASDRVAYRLAREAQDAVCRPCHDAKFNERLEAWSEQPHASTKPRKDNRAAPACVECHEMHRPSRVRAAHLVRDGTDTGCARPQCHGEGTGRHNILAKSHDEKHLFHHPLQTTWRNPPREEKNESVEKARTQSCLACHSPHGSSHLWELKENFQGMCGDCHNRDDARSGRRSISFWPADHEGAADKDKFGKGHVELYRMLFGMNMPADRSQCSVCHGPQSCAETCHRTNGTTGDGRETRRYSDPGTERARHRDDFYVHKWFGQARRVKTACAGRTI